MKLFFTFFLIVLVISCNNADVDTNDTATQSNIAALPYTVAAVYPHDTSSFTQGLVFYKGQLLEGTGNYGHSKLLQADLKDGKAVKKLDLDSTYFGEGITVLGDTVYQLTWREKKVFTYSAKEFKKLKEFPLNTEGWGITNDGQNLIVSDGSSNLYFYEPSTFRLLRSQSVTEDGGLDANLNELEYINGFIYANQWQYNYILKIDPNSGQVVAKMDLSELENRAKVKNRNADYLNGIAFDTLTKKIYVTGKLWPEIFEIKFSY